MGTHMRIALYAFDESSAKTAAEAAFDKVANIESKISSWKKDSELTQLVERDWDTSERARVSRDLGHCLQAGVDFGRKSEGALDITAGQVIALWRKAREKGLPPSPEAIANAMRFVGWKRIELDDSRPAVRLEPGTRIDFGALGKGYALDRASGVLKAKEMPAHLIDFGGDIIVGKRPPGQEAWLVRVPGWKEPVALEHAAVASSGDSEQFLEIDGTRYSHIVDARTGTALTHDLQVTVISHAALLADGYATTLSIVGPDGAAAALSESRSVALIVERENVVWKSPTWPDLPRE